MYCHNIALKMQLISLPEEKIGFLKTVSFLCFYESLNFKISDLIINITALYLFLLNSIYSIKMKDVVKF